jgi:hypothetical protein
MKNRRRTKNLSEKSKNLKGADKFGNTTRSKRENAE